MSESTALTGENLQALFRPLRSYARVILSVSGGSDSMALMHLVHRWVNELAEPPPHIEVASVDHGLRPGSSRDADLVVEAAIGLGFSGVKLSWAGEKPDTGIQESAREARYRLLEELAAPHSSGPVAIVTAHTLDDQAETLLMRLARGSGPDGLAAMTTVRPLQPRSNVFLVRPLLGVPRIQLRAFLIANGHSWIDDPSNENQRFERVRLRRAQETLEALGLSAAMVGLAAKRQRRAVEALDAATDELLGTSVNLHDGLFAGIDAKLYRAAPEEIRVRLLARVLHMYGGSSPAAELAQIERLAEALSASAGATRQTIGGCEVRACGEAIRVFRERGRADLVTAVLEPGQKMTWDNRFQIRTSANSPKLSVRPLDPVTARRIRCALDRRVIFPSRAAATMPAIWAGDELISVGGLLASAIGGASQVRSSVSMRFLYAPNADAR